MLKAKLFTHTDLDGVVSNLIACKYLMLKGYSISTERCGYDNVDTIIKGYLNSWEYDPNTFIFISDICPSFEVVDILDNLPNLKTLIDHHQTAMENISSRKEKGFEWLYIKEGDSASLLVMRYLIGLCKDDSKVLDIMRGYYLLVCLTDLWDSKSRESEDYINNQENITKINALFSALGWEGFKSRFIHNSDIVTSDVEDAIINTLQRIKDNEGRYTKVYTVNCEKDGKNVLGGFGFAQNYISDVAGYIFKRYPELLFVVLINMNSCTCSLRRNGKHPLCESIDLDKVAKQFSENGGGHPFAAGFSFDITSFNSLISKIVNKGFYI